MLVGQLSFTYTQRGQDVHKLIYLSKLIRSVGENCTRPNLGEKPPLVWKGRCGEVGFTLSQPLFTAFPERRLPKSTFPRPQRRVRRSWPWKGARQLYLECRSCWIWNDGRKLTRVNCCIRDALKHNFVWCFNGTSKLFWDLKFVYGVHFGDFREGQNCHWSSKASIFWLEVRTEETTCAGWLLLQCSQALHFGINLFPEVLGHLLTPMLPIIENMLKYCFLCDLSLSCFVWSLFVLCPLFSIFLHAVY